MKQFNLFSIAIFRILKDILIKYSKLSNYHTLKKKQNRHQQILRFHFILKNKL